MRRCTNCWKQTEQVFLTSKVSFFEFVCAPCYTKITTKKGK